MNIFDKSGFAATMYQTIFRFSVALLPNYPRVFKSLRHLFSIFSTYFFTYNTSFFHPTRVSLITRAHLRHELFYEFFEFHFIGVFIRFLAAAAACLG